MGLHVRQGRRSSVHVAKPSARRVWTLSLITAYELFFMGYHSWVHIGLPWNVDEGICGEAATLCFLFGWGVHLGGIRNAFLLHVED